jgi:hypothetical protein
LEENSVFYDLFNQKVRNSPKNPRNRYIAQQKHFECGSQFTFIINNFQHISLAIEHSRGQTA